MSSMPFSLSAAYCRHRQLLALGWLSKVAKPYRQTCLVLLEQGLAFIFFRNAADEF
jgi:hypothetical protein